MHNKLKTTKFETKQCKGYYVGNTRNKDLVHVFITDIKDKKKFKNTIQWIN